MLQNSMDGRAGSAPCWKTRSIHCNHLLAERVPYPSPGSRALPAGRLARSIIIIFRDSRYIADIQDIKMKILHLIILVSSFELIDLMHSDLVHERFHRFIRSLSVQLSRVYKVFSLWFSESSAAVTESRAPPATFQVRISHETLQQSASSSS